jgi:dTDP-4-dehydrorhamnose 3,5-epimerase
VNFTETDIEGCYLVDPAPRGDDRGFFARMFDEETFRERGLAPHFTQFNNSLSAMAGTLRGLHYQIAPHGEDKLVRCIGGAVYDVVLDLRPASRTFGDWVGAELTAENRRMIYAPKGCAHGFLTLRDNTELVYFASAAYASAAERGIRWNDARFSIEWPRAPQVLSEKDRDAPDYSDQTHAAGY